MNATAADLKAALEFIHSGRWADNTGLIQKASNALLRLAEIGKREGGKQADNNKHAGQLLFAFDSFRHLPRRARRHRGGRGRPETGTRG
jgi:hypothetical protein